MDVRITLLKLRFCYLHGGFCAYNTLAHKMSYQFNAQPVKNTPLAYSYLHFSTPDQWQQIFKQHTSSGLQIAAFCKQQKIKRVITRLCYYPFNESTTVNQLFTLVIFRYHIHCIFGNINH